VGTSVTTAVRVLVVDDHPVVRDGVEMLARTHASIQIAGYAPSGRAGLEMAAALQPDVILLDLRLPDMLAPEIIDALRDCAPRAKVVLFTAYPDHPAVGAALEAGAYGVLPKDASSMDLVAAILRAMQPEGSEPARSSSSRRDTHALIARREYDVLRRVATGETNSEIADAMHLSLNTVKAYLRNLMQKLHARNRVEAISRAREMGLL